MATSDNTTPNLKALSLLVDDINETAETVKRLCIEAINIGHDDLRQSSAIIVGARELASVIGWKAEKASMILNSNHEFTETADLWLMTPAYRSAIKAAEVNHG